MSLRIEKLKLGKVILSERIDELMSVDYFALMQIHALHFMKAVFGANYLKKINN